VSGGNAGEGRLLNRGVTIAAIDPELPDVMGMAERNRLLERDCTDNSTPISSRPILLGKWRNRTLIQPKPAISSSSDVEQGSHAVRLLQCIEGDVRHVPSVAAAKHIKCHARGYYLAFNRTPL